MTTQTRTRRIDQALTAATEYVRLTHAGRVAEADQVRRTIDDLVGRFTPAGRFVLPAAVRRALAGQ